eukprot:XP_008765053.1 PREDICTED: uncharacterized protein LOC102548161 [Rattus norvegicus]
MEDQERPGCDGRLQKVAAIYETLINYNGWCITQNSLIIESLDASLGGVLTSSSYSKCNDFQSLSNRNWDGDVPPTELVCTSVCLPACLPVAGGLLTHHEGKLGLCELELVKITKTQEQLFSPESKLPTPRGLVIASAGGQDGIKPQARDWKNPWLSILSSTPSGSFLLPTCSSCPCYQKGQQCIGAPGQSYRNFEADPCSPPHCCPHQLAQGPGQQKAHLHMQENLDVQRRKGLTPGAGDMPVINTRQAEARGC